MTCGREQTKVVQCFKRSSLILACGGCGRLRAGQEAPQPAGNGRPKQQADLWQGCQRSIAALDKSAALGGGMPKVAAALQPRFARMPSYEINAASAAGAYPRKYSCAWSSWGEDGIRKFKQLFWTSKSTALLTIVKQPEASGGGRLWEDNL